MRALHLSTLAAPGEPALVVKPDRRAPLSLSAAVRPADHAAIVAFYQSALHPSPIDRIEVDWHGELLPVSRRFLDAARVRLGAGGALIVVRVLAATSRLADVEADPTLRQFEHVAILSPFPDDSGSLAVLRDLAKLTEHRCEDRYRDMAAVCGLRAPFQLIERLVQDHLSPADIVEVVNDLLEVQLEGLRPDDQLRAVGLRAVERQLSALTPEEIGALLLADAGKPPRTPPLRAATDALRRRSLLRADRLSGWASVIPRLGLRPLLLSDRFEGPAAVHLRKLNGHRKLARELGVEPDPDRRRAALLDGVNPVHAHLNAGRINEADHLLTELERRAPAADLTLAEQGDLSYARARTAYQGRRTEAALAACREALDLQIRGDGSKPRLAGSCHLLGILLSDAKPSEAEAALRTALQLQDDSQAPPSIRGLTWHELGRVLRNTGQYAEAEAAFRTALQLKDEGQDTPTSRGVTWHELGRVLHDTGRYAEAEAAFRTALQLQDEGQDNPTSRSITWDSLGRVLRDTGRHPEAEAAFRTALQLAEEGQDTPTSRGITWHELGRVLHDTGRHLEAEAAFRTALQLKDEGQDTPTSRGVTWHELGRVLHDTGRHPEAEAAFRTALQLKDEGRDTPTSRGITWDHLGRVLQDAGRHPEAEAAFRTALQLQDEGQDTPTSRSITWESLGRVLRDTGRHPEAEAAFRTALQLQDEGQDTPTSRGITWHHLGRVLHDTGRHLEAEAAFRTALQLADEGQDTPTSRGITWHHLGRVLHDTGRHLEAEAAFRTSLQLADEGQDTPASNSMTWDHLGRVLRDTGRHAEAEAAFINAIDLTSEAPLSDRGTILDHYARLLHKLDRTTDADQRFHEALQLKRDGGAAPKSLAATLRAFAALHRTLNRTTDAALAEAEADALDPQPLAASP